MISAGLTEGMLLDTMPVMGPSTSLVSHFPIGAHSVIEALKKQCAESPEARFLSFHDREISYGEFDRLVSSATSGFAQEGLVAGDLVAIFMRNSLEELQAVFALARLGAVPVLVNTEYRGELLRHVFVDSRARFVLADESLAERVQDVAGSCPDLEGMFVSGAVMPPGSLPAKLLSEIAGEAEAPTRQFALRDPFVVLYTSGTTGPSKGVIVSHGHALTFASDWVRTMEFTGRDVLFSPLPLFHGIGFLLGVLPTLLTGASMHIVERFSASRFWDDVRRCEATVAHIIFSIAPILLSAPPDPVEDRRHSLRAAYIGPSKLSAEFEERFGAPLVEVYGQTETGIVALGPLGKVRPGSCGQVNDMHFEVAIVNDDDSPVAVGETGEIVVRPRYPFSMMSGYLNRPEATAAAYQNLWHHTGDRGRFDEDGWLYFVDRAKDCIRRRGENISSYEVELIAVGHPDVVEVAAIPVPSELEEEEVKVWIVAHDAGAFDYADFVTFCEREMPTFMVPRFIEVVEALPKTPSQKAMKYELRARGNQGLTKATWDRTTRRTWGA